MALACRVQRPALRPGDGEENPVSPKHLGLSAALAALLACAGCESNSAGRGADDTGAATQTQSRTVEVVIDDAAIRMPNVLPRGTHTLVVTNNSQAEHTFRIEGKGANWEEKIPAGQTKNMVVTFEPGSYRAFSPTGGSAAEGADVALTVTE
jgi:hypothetical protein